MDVIILAGGLSHERDVSVRSGRRVAEELRNRGMTVSVHDVDTNLIPTLREHDDAVVWPLLHGASGEDGSLQALLELTGSRYVGTRSREARVAWVKSVAKAVVARDGVATPDYVTLPQSLFREVGAEQVLDAIVDRFSLPLVVKPARGGSALGVTLVEQRQDLARAMVHCFAYGDTAMIETAVQGTEVAVSVIGTGDEAHALPPVEIVCDGPYDYDARYNPGRVEYFTPARLDEDATRAVTEAAVTVHRRLGLRDLSRIDIILDGDRAAHVLDINIAPGLTETSLFPQAALAHHEDLGALYERIVLGAAS
ncbi:ATP-grasp domain-containing protein [Demequina sp. NBRC 110053]|uniref:D-alanine--D-alanine ligase family protein n=1 Tax=Demequina sp. NBRC 110053 TaxID=1570342 RepID=UPI000A05C6FD|nr:ATP-grasp domain-containing protein [Demequina sp. NBRC 110053]